MTKVLLIRHAHTEAVGQYLAGRAHGVPLSDQGIAEAQRLGAALHGVPLDGIYASPLERATATAHAIAHGRDHHVITRDDLTEVDFGEWTGKTFAELDALPAWRTFNHRRAIAVVPNGEPAPAVQARIVSAVDALVRAHPSQTIAIVSHADVIRGAVLHYLGIPLDHYHRITISPASVTAFAFGGDAPRVLHMNWSPHLETL
jgi:broad specificity phosphatase PhoE